MSENVNINDPIWNRGPTVTQPRRRLICNLLRLAFFRKALGFKSLLAWSAISLLVLYLYAGCM